jgi:hypothetical protein
MRGAVKHLLQSGPLTLRNRDRLRSQGLDFDFAAARSTG